MANYFLKEKSRGFTLVELLVVIGIIALLTALAVSAVRYARAQAKISKAEQAINQIYTAMSMLANDSNSWPGPQAFDSVAGAEGGEVCADGCAFGLADARAGITATDGSYPGWQGPYMNSMPLDPWDNEYFFDPYYELNIDNEPSGCGGTISSSYAAVVGSYGPSGAGNNEYNCDDIIKIIAR